MGDQPGHVADLSGTSPHWPTGTVTLEITSGGENCSMYGDQGSGWEIAGTTAGQCEVTAHQVGDADLQADSAPFLIDVVAD